VSGSAKTGALKLNTPINIANTERMAPRQNFFITCLIIAHISDFVKCIRYYMRSIPTLSMHIIIQILLMFCMFAKKAITVIIYI